MKLLLAYIGTSWISILTLERFQLSKVRTNLSAKLNTPKAGKRDFNLRRTHLINIAPTYIISFANVSILYVQNILSNRSWRAIEDLSLKIVIILQTFNADYIQVLSVVQTKIKSRRIGKVQLPLKKKKLNWILVILSSSIRVIEFQARPLELLSDCIWVSSRAASQFLWCNVINAKPREKRAGIAVISIVTTVVSFPPFLFARSVGNVETMDQLETMKWQKF